MTHLVILRDGEPVGYVDTETGEREYVGPGADADASLEAWIESAGMYTGAPADDWGGEGFWTGEGLEEFIRGLENPKEQYPEEHHDVIDWVTPDEEIEVIERENYMGESPLDRDAGDGSETDEDTS